MAVGVVEAAAHRADGVGAATPSVPISSCTLVVPASAAICVIIAASAYAAVPALLSYYATFAASFVCFARAVWPDRVDAALACARTDLEADLRRLRDAWARATRPAAAAAPVHYAADEEAVDIGWDGRARRERRDAHTDAARAARFVLRMVALVARLAATVLLDAARDEARAWAPSVLGYVRRVVDAIRPPLSSACNEGVVEDEVSAVAGFVLKDIVCLVGTGFYVLFTVHLLFGSGGASGMQFCAVCFAAACGLTMLIADWIDPPDDDDDADETADTTGTDDAGDAAAAGVASRDEELEVRESWQFLWVLVLVTYCADAFLLHATLGPRPTTLAILALCDFEVLNAGRQVQLSTPDDDGAVGRWRRGAMVVYAACSVKTLVVYLVLDCYLAALGFLWLFVMADLLLAEEDNLADFDASGEEVDDQDAGFQEDITGGAEEELDEEAMKEHSNTSSSSSEDKDEMPARCDCDSSSEDEEENSAQCDSSEEHEIVDDEEEERHEEADYDSGGSTDDSWDSVDDIDDPEMPAKANCRSNRKSRRLFVARKHAP